MAIAEFVPFPFTPHLKNALLNAGFVHTRYDADWEDVGGPESGPCLVGHNAYDVYAHVWVHDSSKVTVFYVEDDMVRAIEVEPNFSEEFLASVSDNF